MTDLEKNNLIEKIEDYQEKTKNSLVMFFYTAIPIFFGFVIGVFPAVNEQIASSILFKVSFFVICSIFVGSICITINHILYMINNAKKAKHLILNNNYEDLIELANEDTIKENNYLNLAANCFYFGLSFILILIFMLLFLGN